MERRTFTMREDVEMEIKRGGTGPRGAITVSDETARPGGVRINFDIPGIQWTITVGGDDARALESALEAAIKAKRGK